MARLRILLTEGSSLTSREIVTCLGPIGHQIEVLDSNPACLARFSRWVSRVHHAPHAGSEPVAYVETLVRTVLRRRIDVVLPTHEQAWLLASAQSLLTPQVRLALAPARAFEQLQSKLAFARLLDELELPQPSWRVVEGVGDLADFPFPYWLKAPFSTAGQGVRRVVDPSSREAALDGLLGEAPLMAQRSATGQYGQVQGLFDRGRLAAVHTSVQRGVGIGGSAAARLSVDHAIARRHIAALGEALGWHGGLTLDYFHTNGHPSYIECNPRTVEPGNAAASGVNIPEMQVRLSLGEALPAPTRIGRPGVRTHGTIALLLGSAGRGASRRALIGELRDALGERRLYADSGEQLTPLRRDPPSLIAAAFVVARLLGSPSEAEAFSTRAVSDYSIGPDTIAALMERAGD